MRSVRQMLAAALSIGVLSATFISAVAPPAHAALPTGPATTGVTGDRPGATELSFRISDQVGASVDVGTGNLRVQTSGLSLAGVNGQVNIGQTYNSLSTALGSTSTTAATRWTFSVQGIGHLSQGASGVVIYTAGDGSTWPYTPVTGTPGAYTAPDGAKADLAASGSSFTLTDRGSRTVATFNSDGRVTSISDRNANTTTVAYTASGIPSSVTSTAGPSAARTATMTYSSSSFIFNHSQSGGSSSRDVQYIKNASSQLVRINDASGTVTEFTYSNDRLSTITAPGGAVTTIRYVSTSSKVASISQANNTPGSPGTSVTRFTYPSTTQTLVARPNTDQSAAVTAVPRTTYTIVAATGLATGAIDEMGRARAATYTPNGDVATSTAGTGSNASTSTNTYGANGGDSLTSAESAPGATSTTEYGNTAAGTAYLPTSSTDARGNVSTFTYNGAGNPASSTNALAATASVVHNSRGQVTSATAPGNGTNRTIYGYNSNFQMSTLTPVTGSSLQARAMTYDGYGRLATETDGRGVTITYGYDNNDRLLTTSFSDGTPTVTNTYDDDGLLRTRVDAHGTTTWTYDRMGRLISRVNTFAGGTISYGYDKSSNLVTVTDTRGTVTNTFDASGVLTKITYPSASTTKEVVFVTDDQGRRTHTYLNLNAALTAWMGHTEQQYGRGGRVIRAIAETVTPQGVPETVSDVSYCYNTAGTAPTCSTNRATDTDKLRWENDNVTGQLTTYGYDTAGRLLSVTQTGGTDPIAYTYTYDSRGNRLTATTTGGTSTSQTLAFNAGNQVTTTGFAYDGAGNMTTDTSGSYTYNGSRQMTSATRSAGTSNYKYAGTSQVETLQQQNPGVPTFKLVYGRTNQYGIPVIEQVHAGSGATTEINYIDNDPVTGQPLLLRTATGVVSLYVYSGTGNPTAILRDVTGSGSNKIYDPYGVATITSEDPGGQGTRYNPFVFKGGTQDRGTGWILYGNRWYNPTIGRWTQQDTLDAPLDPTNANRYAYAGADPINNTDPTGLRSCTLRESVGIVASYAAAYGIAFATGGGIVGFITGGPAGAAAAAYTGAQVGASVGLIIGIYDIAVNGC